MFSCFLPENISKVLHVLVNILFPLTEGTVFPSPDHVTFFITSHVHYAEVAMVIQSLSPVLLSATPWTAACQASLSFTVFWSLLKFMPVELVMLSNHLILCPFFFWFQSFWTSSSFSMSEFFASGGQSLRVSASASVLSMNIQSWFSLGLTSLSSLQSYILFKSLLQHHNSKASVLQCSAFFMVQLSHPY